jgi:hypothetical protein
MREIKSTVLLIVALVITSNAHALSDDVKNRAKADLGKECYELFTTIPTLFNGNRGYRIIQFGVTKIFMINGDKSSQRCTYSHTFAFRPNKEEFEKKALQDCSKVMGNGSVCEVYARQDEIVYLSQSARLKSVEQLYKDKRLEEIMPILKEMESKGLATLSLEERGRYEFYMGKLLLDGNAYQAAIHFNRSWSTYSYVLGAAEEAKIIANFGLSQGNWEALRNAAEYFLNSANDEQKKLYPNISEKYHLTDSYFAAESVAQEERDRVALLQQELEDKRNEKLRAEEERKFAIAEKKRQEKERLDSIIAEREARKLAEKERQESLKLAKRMRDEKSKQDDQTCRGYGVAPGSAGYISCRIQLDNKDNDAMNQSSAVVPLKKSEKARLEAEALKLKELREQQEQYAEKQKQFEEIQRQNQEQLRLSEQRRREQAESDQEARAWGALINYGLGISAGRPRSAPSEISTTHYLKSQWYVQGNTMCKYDDGSILNMGSGICPTSK